MGKKSVLSFLQISSKCHYNYDFLSTWYVKPRHFDKSEHHENNVKWWTKSTFLIRNNIAKYVLCVYVLIWFSYIIFRVTLVKVSITKIMFKQWTHYILRLHFKSKITSQYMYRMLTYSLCSLHVKKLILVFWKFCPRV